MSKFSVTWKDASDTTVIRDTHTNEDVVTFHSYELVTWEMVEIVLNYLEEKSKQQT